MEPTDPNEDNSEPQDQPAGIATSGADSTEGQSSVATTGTDDTPGILPEPIV